MTVTFRRITAQETVHLRHTVLWPSYPVSHVLLPEDDVGLHFGAFLTDSESAGEPVSVISFFYEVFPGPLGPNAAPPAARFRKFSTAPSQQGKGIGSRLLAFGAAEVTKVWPDVRKLWCDGRESSKEWYIKRRMYVIESEPRFFKGDIPYRKMGMDLGA